MATHFTLNTGARIPSVGLGTYKVGTGVVADVVSAAVKVGLSEHLLFTCTPVSICIYCSKFTC